MFSAKRWFVLVLLIGGAMALLFPTSSLVAAPPSGEPKPGIVFLAGGAGGLDPLGLSARMSLPGVGIKHEFHDYIWGHGPCRVLRDLQDTRHLLSKADELADWIRRIKEAEPDRPVYLIGHSGGGGLVLAVAEQLPPATLERVILLSAAVAPTHDLRGALRATRGEIVSFHSDIDWFWLGWGTSNFGTMDRYYGSAAGKVGFTIPEKLDAQDREMYKRLVQIGWQPEMIFKNHGGTHASTVMPGFLTRHVAPWLKP